MRTPISVSPAISIGYIEPHTPAEGRFAIVTDVGTGCGGRGSARAHEVIAGRVLSPWRSKGAQTNGAEADGEVVWLWRPKAGVKLAEASRPDRVSVKTIIR